MDSKTTDQSAINNEENLNNPTNQMRKDLAGKTLLGNRRIVLVKSTIRNIAITTII